MRTEGTIDLAQTPLVLNGERLVILVALPNGQAISHISLPTESLRTINRISVAVEGDGGYSHLGHHVTPWATVEDIAKYVAGDGTDPQRVALADGIRSGRR